MSPIGVKYSDFFTGFLPIKARCNTANKYYEGIIIRQFLGKNICWHKEAVQTFAIIAVRL